ncbi:benzoylformate decarboxylase [Chromatiales bacterium (ex Bugula neritina AB1)]|nr:benzoylformate decarboxylase [Chromatiales bacterium (ex Bugula neritina AB1)]
MAQLTGREIFLSILLDEGIDYLFGNPGTTELPIMAALPELPQLNYVLGLQESVVVAMADGYSRASGRLTACNVHVAPGLGNAMGAIYNAHWVGSPLIITAGQQEQGHGLTEPLLYAPLPPMVDSLVKWSTEVTRLEDLPRILRRAAKVAMSPPTGPVFISLPGDILNATAEIETGRSTRVDAVVRPSDTAIHSLAERLARAEKPAIIAGHELATSRSLDEAAALATLLGVPVYQQTVVDGAHFYSLHDCYIGGLSRDQKKVHAILEDYDTLLFLGSDVLRMSVYSEIDPLPAGIQVLQIAERAHELGKNYPADVAINAHPGETLRALLPVVEKLVDPGRVAAGIASLKTDNWSTRREALQNKLEALRSGHPINGDYLMRQLARVLPDNAVLVDEGLTASRYLPDLVPYRDSKSYFGLASGGIGFAVAGVVGMQLAQPERPHVAVIGDGSSLYGIQALWTAAHLKLPITYVIANNRGYRILKQRVQAYHGTQQFIGMDFDDPLIDFVKLAESMGVTAYRVEKAEELEHALASAIASGDTVLLDVQIDKAL